MRHWEQIRIFNPHSPCGERLLYRLSVLGVLSFQSTLPMRGATVSGIQTMVGNMFSIHTPHAGSDTSAENRNRSFKIFNPHSPCGERRKRNKQRYRENNFSIHTPHAGSDKQYLEQEALEKVFNPHSPCGERLKSVSGGRAALLFNPHSPCGERH